MHIRSLYKTQAGHTHVRYLANAFYSPLQLLLIMTLLAPLALLSGLGLEIAAILNPASTSLKLAATVVSIGYLISFVVFKPDGPFGNVWPLGMNIYCLAQRCWNYLWLKDTGKFHRKDAKQNGNAEENKTMATGSHGVLDALDIALTFRGVGWLVKPFLHVAPLLRDHVAYLKFC